MKATVLDVEISASFLEVFVDARWFWLLTLWAEKSTHRLHLFCWTFTPIVVFSTSVCFWVNICSGWTDGWTQCSLSRQSPSKNVYTYYICCCCVQVLSDSRDLRAPRVVQGRQVLRVIVDGLARQACLEHQARPAASETLVHRVS